jgi:hypothetical protein
MGRFCDHVVAVDGRYALYEGNRVESGAAEVDAVIQAAAATGMGLTLHQPRRTWRDEMEKRSYCFKLAELERESSDDWYFILDADELVIESPSKEVVKQGLADLPKDIGGVVPCLWEKTDPLENEQKARLSEVLAVEYEWGTGPAPRFWRAYQSMRVVDYHYNYIALDDNGEKIALWGQDGHVKNRVKWHSATADFVIENRNRLRAKKRDASRMKYYTDRNDVGLESKRRPLEEMELV